MIEEAAFGFDGDIPIVWKILSKITTSIFGIHAWAVSRLDNGRLNFRNEGTIVAVNNAYGIALAYLKMRGRLSPNVVFIAMGLFGKKPQPLIQWAYRRILRHVTMATISQSERQHLSSILGNITTHYIPFGVDHRFWLPGAPNTHDDFVLSVGNDPHRDYETLVRAWQPDFPTLRIVTRQSVPSERPSNVEIIPGDWRTQTLSDTQLRDMVRASRFVVIPVRDTLQPSGQSACLQAMACGKVVIMSDISGLWDRTLIRTGENCMLVPPGNCTALTAAVRQQLNNPQHASAIGRAARRLIEDSFNADVMANALLELCNRTPAQRAQPESETA